eukprot:scaffold11389_cov258-Ochromonas_danica.AAC.1
MSLSDRDGRAGLRWWGVERPVCGGQAKGRRECNTAAVLARGGRTFEDSSKNGKYESAESTPCHAT